MKYVRNKLVEKKLLAAAIMFFASSITLAAVVAALGGKTGGNTHWGGVVVWGMCFWAWRFPDAALSPFVGIWNVFRRLIRPR